MNILESLNEFQETDKTVRITKLILEHLPYSPPFIYYSNLKGAIERYNLPYSTEKENQIMNTLTNENLNTIVKVGSTIDKIDTGLGIVTGFQNLFQKMKKTNQRTFESDPQQAIDAATKAIALGYMIHLAFDENKIQNFLNTYAGKELLIYFLAVEIALPFTDNFIEEGGNLIYKLLNQNKSGIVSRFSNFGGESSFFQANEILTGLKEQINTMSSSITQSIKPLEEAILNKLPMILNISDSLTGGIATVLDFLPIWKFLSTRFAIESTIQKV